MTLTPAGPAVFRSYAANPELVRRLRAASEAMAPLPALPPFEPDPERPVVVEVAGSEAALQTRLDGAIPEWGAGFAIPRERRIILPALGARNRDLPSLTRTLRHEFAHVALNDALAPARIPRWFDEGYARWAAGEWNETAAWRLRLAFALDRAPSLDSLALSWPAGSVEADVAYLLATSAVGYLVEQGGEPGLAAFLERWRDSGSIETALRRTYGRTLGQFEHDWQRVARSRYGWAAALSHATVFWAFAALLLIALYVIRRRQNAERRAALTDPPPRPAYWLGEEVLLVPREHTPEPEAGDRPSTGEPPATDRRQLGAADRSPPPAADRTPPQGPDE